MSRLALAKAIKTPDAGEDAEPWTKSVIFNQPFIKELHKQKQQQSINHSQKKYRLETKNGCHQQQRQIHHHLQHKNHNPKSSGSGSFQGQGNLILSILQPRQFIFR